MSKEVVILSASRTPIGSFLGSLSSLPAPTLGATAIKDALAKAKIDPVKIDQVIMGNVLTAGVGQAPARQATIFAGLDKGVAAMTINKVCGSGLQAVKLATQAIQTGESDFVVAGGMENMSQAPHLMPGARNGTKMGDIKLKDSMVSDGLWDVYNNFHMGNAAEMCVKKYSFTREEQDAFAQRSFERAQKAQADGAFKNELCAVEVPQRKGNPVIVDTDEGPGKANFAKMPSLRPAFDKEGTITAANASTINDGASALVLADAEKAKAAGLKPIAKIVATAVHAQEPEWFTTAPVEAVRKALSKAGLSVGDIDLWEINEAFATVTMAAMKTLEIDEAKVNVNGGAISLGHPIGCSGARVLTTLVHAMKNRGAKRGCATLCIGGGEGIATIVELV